MRITFKQLNLFIALVQHKNMTHAAEALFLSQSAASMALAELESQLREPLFDRLGKKLILNANGKKLLPKAIEIIDRVQEVENLFTKNTAANLTGHLKIGASTTIGNYLLPTMISQFMSRHPEVTISLRVANSESIVNDLETFTIDIGFIEDSIEVADIESTLLGEDQLIIFCSPKHILANKTKITIKDLEKADWILRESGSGTRNIFDKVMSQHLDSLHVILELSSTEAIKQFVKQGAGISCLSELALMTELQSKELIALPLKIIQAKRSFYRILHKKKYTTQLVRTFLEEFT